MFSSLSYPPIVRDLATSVQQAGGRLLVVGGTVRDHLLGQITNDIDLEIYGLDEGAIIKVLKQFGAVDHVGRQFSIFKLKVGTQFLDISLPRRETKTGSGHRGFTVTADPDLDPANALRRRDFTINAIAVDPLTNEVIDPFHGQSDLAHRQLRVVDAATFLEDPLRVMRAIQLTARFALRVEAASQSLLTQGVSRVSELPAERFWPEWEKLFLKSQQPSIGLQLAHDIGLFSAITPALQRLSQTAQDPKYHPEGSVWRHALYAVDWAKKIAPENLAVLLAAWLHDVGKAETTVENNGRIRSLGHAEASVTIAESFLSAQGFPPSVITHVRPLIAEHMNAGQLYIHRADLGPGAVRRLANRLRPATIAELVQVTTADQAARQPVDHTVPSNPAGQWLLAEAGRLNIATRAPEPIIRGQDLQALGWAPGPVFGQIIERAERLAETGKTRQDILKLLSVTSDAQSGLAALQ